LVVLEIDFVVSGQEGKGKMLSKKFNKKSTQNLIKKFVKRGQKKDNKLFIFLNYRHNE
jgi:fatty acid-binding protein DegV